VSDEREQRTVFGEVAQLYDDARPSYPDEVFDTVIAYGELSPNDQALEIGAGTGKATEQWVARRLDVLALEPSAGMAGVLRAKGVRVEQLTFEDFAGRPSSFRLVCAAQAWHWVTGADRYQRAANLLEIGGTLALFWNKPRHFGGALGADVDAVYAKHAPALADRGAPKWSLEATLDEITATPGYSPPELREITWVQPYTTQEYMRLQETHSDHRMLPDGQRVRLHAAVRETIEAHGGAVDVIYDTQLYLARRV
jgi:hypothetical protein